MPVDVVGFAYAAAVAAGGMIGYAKAGKKIKYDPERLTVDRTYFKS